MFYLFNCYLHSCNVYSGFITFLKVQGALALSHLNNIVISSLLFKVITLDLH